MQIQDICSKPKVSNKLNSVRAGGRCQCLIRTRNFSKNAWSCAILQPPHCKEVIMKKNLLLTAALIPLFFSCATTTKKAVPPEVPVAVLTVYANSAVPWFNSSNQIEEARIEGGLLTGPIGSLLNKNNIEVTGAQERADSAAAELIEKLKEAGFQTAETERIHESAAYKKESRAASGNTTLLLAAGGYDVLTRTSARLSGEVCRETGAKSTLYVQFKFQKILAKTAGGKKGVAARVSMTVRTTDASGKVIFTREYTAQAKEAVKMTESRHWDKNALEAQFPAVTGQVIEAFIADIQTAANSN